MEYTGIFVDDEDDVYASLLSVADTLSIKYLNVEEIADLASKITSYNPLVVAIDYRLDEHVDNLRKSQSFKGSGLAQLLRDRAIEDRTVDHAIVLVSAESNVRRFFRPDQTAHDLFDRIYVKEEISNNPALVRGELIGLCAGYERLKSMQGKYSLSVLAKAEGDDGIYLDYQELRSALDAAMAPHIVARVFLKRLIQRNGILLDANEVIARFGCSKEHEELVLPLVSEAAYHGLFSEPWKRWWTHGVDRIARDLFGVNPTSLSAKARSDILSRRLGCVISPALSPWNKSPDELIAFSCACCHESAELRHSVAVFEKSLPKHNFRRRICWDCIQTDRYEALQQPLVVDDTDAKLAEKVKMKKRDIGADVR